MKRRKISISFEIDLEEKDVKELKSYLGLFIDMTLPEWCAYKTNISDIEVKLE